MIEVMNYYEDFGMAIAEKKGKIVAYGLGAMFKEHHKLLPVIDFFCDKNAKDIAFFKEGVVCSPIELEKINEFLYIVVFVKDSRIYEEVVAELSNFKISGKITGIFQNKYFGLGYPRYAKRIDLNQQMKINIVCKREGWILTKFADRLEQYLKKEGVEVLVSPQPRADVDLNHHIPYYLEEELSYNDTFMITHVDSAHKLEMIKKKLEVARVGICMSKETRDRLISCGLPSSKLCYINPAQDNIIEPHKYHIGITNRCYDLHDVRKRAMSLVDALKGINEKYFKFTIMGEGWDNIVAILRDKGFQVEYYSEFEYERYNQLMSKLDYYIYMGFDEGSMGYLDALRAGVGTIVTPQGYHLDVDCPIDYPCSTVTQFHNAFLDLQQKREQKISAIETWNWDNYAKKHLQLWKYILRREDLKNIYNNQLEYEDGVFSLLIEDVELY